MNLNDIRKNLALGIPLTMLNLRVTYYSRVSTEHLDQQNSLQNQISYFEDMIHNNYHWTFVSGYVDDGITGISALKRTHFLQMINDAKQGKFDLILTKEISRFSRNTLDSIKYTRELLESGVAVLFINDNINTALPDAELRLTIMASLAQEEIRRLSERVKFGMQRAIKKGIILGNNQLYGYYKNHETGNLVINDLEAKIVQKIFYLYGIEKYSLAQIVKYLNSLKIKTSHHHEWCSATVMRMLKNPKYKGYYCGRKSEVVDYMTKKERLLPKENWLIYPDFQKIPPIVEESLWNKANNRFNINPQRKTTNQYALSSKIICHHDGHFYHARKLKNNDIAWSCSKYLTEGKKQCLSPHLRESELNVILDNYFSSLNIQYDEVNKILLDIYQQYFNSHHNLSELTNREHNLQSKKQKLIELYTDNLITKDDFSLNIQECNKLLKEVNNEIISLTSQNHFQTIENHLEYLLNELINSFLFKETLIKVLISKIDVFQLTLNEIKLDIFTINKLSLERIFVFKRQNSKEKLIKYIINFFVVRDA